MKSSIIASQTEEPGLAFFSGMMTVKVPSLRQTYLLVLSNTWLVVEPPLEQKGKNQWGSA
jgi:hypothetical protein